MENIEYIGEHLWPGRLGQMAIILGLVSGLLAMVAYFFATRHRERSDAGGWKAIGRAGFLLHGASVFSVIGIIFYVMTQQYYEYQYVWAHVSEDLPFKYIFSAFWEGQEGSFLLWMFWHVVLGFILMFTSGKWEGPVMATLAGIEVIIISMILGVYVGFGDEPTRVGSNPLLLLRQTMDAPIFANADYLSLIKGNGLNPLLQNYWMTIHPPTLFLGFASTSVPFAFAVAGLWLRDHRGWLRPVLPWALFSGAILGTGILMGGAWAYEALTFGGYWAWDPVENMSLVPWLILIAGIHTNLVARSTGYSIRSTYLFYLFTFVFIVYSTFLTRSGILGDTSVHAFTEMGLEVQLVTFIVLSVLLSLGLFFSRYKDVPAPAREESTPSKEFWMFIGTLVLLFSALIITASTSLPVYNKIVQIFDPAFEGKVITDPVPHYNKYQLWIGVFIGLLSGFSQYLRFREHNWAKHRRKFLIHLGVASAAALLVTILTTLWIEANAWQYWLLLFAGWFTVITNLDYVITFLRGNLKTAGSVFSHIGFGLMIVGILASGLNKRFISSNPFLMEGIIEGADEARLMNNIMLFKGSPMIMGDYEVTYIDDTLDTYTRTFEVNYKRRNKAGEVVEEFNLYPNVLYEKDFTKIAASNPATKRYLAKDVFTHIPSLPTVEIDLTQKQRQEDSLNYRSFKLLPDEPVTFMDTVALTDRDTFSLRAYRLQLLELVRGGSHPDYQPEEGDLTISAKVQVEKQGEDEAFIAEPLIVLRGELLYTFPAQLNEINTRVRLNADVFDRFLSAEDDLEYESFQLKQGETFQYAGYNIQFAGFQRDPSHPFYQAEEGDIPVGALLNIEDADGNTYMAQPVYFIRGNRPFNIKDEAPAAGLHFRFVSLDPGTESLQLMVAKADSPEAGAVPVEVATDAYRSDWIVLEAIVFPGINLFWLGSLLMMIGLGIAMAYRIQQRRA